MKDILSKIISVVIAATLVITPILALSDSSVADTAEEVGYSGLTPWDNVNQVLAKPFFALSSLYWAVGTWIGGDSSSAEISDPDTVTEYAQMVKSESVIKMINVVSSLSSKLVLNDRETWALTESYVNRMAEISASTLWNEDADVNLQDPNAVLTYAGIYGLISGGNGNTQSALDWGMYHSMDELIALYSNSQQLYKDISAGFVWNGHTDDYRTNQHMMLDFETVCQVTSSSYNTVYLDLDYLSNLDISTGSTDSAGQIYSDGGAIRSLESTEWTAVSGQLSLKTLIDAGLKSGWYQLQEGHTYAGPFYPSMNGNSAPCNGGAVLIFGSDIGFITVQDGALHMDYNGQGDVDIGYLSVSYNYGSQKLYTGGEADGKSYYQSKGSNDTLLKELITAYSQYYAQLYERLSSASSAAHLMWKIQGEARSSNIFLSPSSVLPQIKELGYDEDTAYILYRVALDESAQWYDTYGKVFQDGQLTISEESLKVKFTGSVYDRNGAEVSVGDTSFIPVVYLKDYVLTEGHNEFSEGAGILIGVQTGSIYHLTSGSYFTVDEGGITYDGKATDSVTLHVKSVEEIGIHDLNKPQDPEVPQTYEGNVLFMVIIVEFAIIIGLLGIIVRNPIAIIIAVVIAVLGIVFSPVIADIVLGWL
jgi:hypothetical protein